MRYKIRPLGKKIEKEIRYSIYIPHSTKNILGIFDTLENKFVKGNLAHLPFRIWWTCSQKYAERCVKILNEKELCGGE